jgi:hypothetical protein
VGYPTDDARHFAATVFMTTAGPRLVKRVAEVLAPLGVAVMPLKGVLLQKLVYGGDVFRPITDVDLLVPPDRFMDAVAALQGAGFTRVRWEPGGWEVNLSDPSGPPLSVDLHRRLTRTSRSRLTAGGLFERGRSDTRLFDAPVVLPEGQDLFAHLLLHATLHWLNRGELHRPRDFQAVASALSLEPRRCADHLGAQGLEAHALALLPLIQLHEGGTFCHDVLIELARPRLSLVRPRLASSVARMLWSGSPPGGRARRLAGLALAPSLVNALMSAARERLEHLRTPG